MKFVYLDNKPNDIINQYMVTHADFTVWHSAQWAAFQLSNGKSKKNIYFYIEDDGKLLSAGFIQVMLRGGRIKYGYIQGGPLYKTMNDELYKTFYEGVVGIAKNNDLLFITIDSARKIDEYFEKTTRNPLYRHDFDIKPVIPTFTTTVDLSYPEDEILERMKPKGRYNIKLAAKKCVVIREGRGNEVDIFYDILLETTSRDGFRANQREYYHKFLDTVPGAKFLVAVHEDEIIAGGIFTYNHRQALYYYGASSNNKRNLMAPYLLQWEAMRLGKCNSCKYYDFMGIAAPGKEADPLSGVTDFKMKFGGEVVQFNTPYTIVNKMWFYKLLRYADSFMKMLRNKNK